MAGESNKSTAFSAAGAAIGYLYQVRHALLSALQWLAEDRSFAVYFETLDDVVFEPQGLELLTQPLLRFGAVVL